MSAPFGSTVIPSLGMTFAEGGAKFAALLAEYAACAATKADDMPEYLVIEACEIREAMFANPPQTADDALAVVSVLADREDEVFVGEAGALALVRDCLAGLVGKGVASTDTLPGTPATALPPQPPCPPKGFTPQRDLRGWLEAGAPIVWREQPGARSPGSRYTVVDCTIVGPFFVSVILQDQPEVPKAPFHWSVYRLLQQGFVVRGDEPTLDAAKAAAEEAIRRAVEGELAEPAAADPEPSTPTTHAAAARAFRDGEGAATDAWFDYANDDRLEAELTILADRFRRSVASAGPVTTAEDAHALALLQSDLLDALVDGYGEPGQPLYGARAGMVATISDALGAMARKALATDTTPGLPSLPPTASE